MRDVIVTVVVAVVLALLFMYLLLSLLFSGWRDPPRSTSVITGKPPDRVTGIGGDELAAMTDLVIRPG